VFVAFDEVTNDANAVSFVVSTELIKVTISANESLSASTAVNIASTLPFSVTILLSIDELNAENPFVDDNTTWDDPDTIPLGVFDNSV
jgi:hypothetical protein